MPASLDSFKVLTFDVVGTLIDFEKGVLDSIRSLGGEQAVKASEDEIFEAYKRGRDLHYGRSSFAMKDVYLHLAKELGFRSDEATADAFQLASSEPQRLMRLLGDWTKSKTGAAPAGASLAIAPGAQADEPRP